MTAITLNPFIQAYKLYPLGEMPFLQRQKIHALKNKPYQGWKILHNMSLTLESLFKIEVLLAGGADLTVTNPTFMEHNPLAATILKEAGVKVQLQHDFQDDFDFCMDCCGELLGQVTPRIGTAEITRTGTIIYESEKPNYPVISIDESKIKNLETILGTGEAFVRAFQQITQTDIRDKKFMVVGYGKVGQGIVRYLKQYTKEIVVVSGSDRQIEQAEKAGLIAINASNAIAVEAEASQCFGIVTATGRKNVISDNFNPQAFKGRYLANMGGEDEFGDGFETKEVLANKKPLNFLIDKPTLMRYLDPVFYAHNLAIEILANSYLKGIHPFPSFLAEIIVNEWQDYFGESLSSDRN